MEPSFTESDLRRLHEHTMGVFSDAEAKVVLGLLADQRDACADAGQLALAETLIQNRFAVGIGQFVTARIRATPLVRS
jgi:hypothetical protein